VLLPMAPFTETSGTYVSLDGTVQSFTGVVRPLGETRPGWKVLRVLGELLGASVSRFNSSEDVRAAALANFSEASLGARVNGLREPEPVSSVLERVTDVPIYHADPLVRRGQALSLSAYGKQARVRVNAETARQIGVGAGAPVRLTQAGYVVNAVLSVDETIATGAVRVPLGTEVSAALGDASAAITVEAA